MNDQEFFGMTINVVNGKTYWQAGGFATVGELVYHVRKYSKGRKHLLIYKQNKKGELVFHDHLSAGTYWEHVEQEPWVQEAYKERRKKSERLNRKHRTDQDDAR